ncbi:helix-turn-helix transcriptional regulator [Sporosarcina jiandibaonis]|uniref:helix-turn-helix transcriptional regulator n=1 Tax=Sporosarcina jiandibaonis TaxID=2715535 RepID=UPI0015546B8C|nr:helix-turn-helix transcriptional regulator [Sporosarcina jiandibaonis]
MEVLLINTLGERIRKLRKEQKFTLEALAGDELTKGMLSLIENNKANPSMESLTYIARRLGVEVSELLEEVSSQELREVLEKAEKLFHTKVDEVTDEYDQLIALVEPYIPKLAHDYEAARLLEMYSRTLSRLNRGGWQEPSDKAASIYEEMNIIPRRADIGIFRAMVKFTKRDYEGSLKIMLQERRLIEEKAAFIDPMTRIDLDYHEAILHYAVGDAQSARRLLETAIDFSKEQRVFYNIDSLYRLSAVHAMMTLDEKLTNYYSEKLKLYGDFTDDEEAFYFPIFLEIHYLNSYKKSYEEALQLLNPYIETHGKDNSYSPYMNLEKGKTFYGLGRIEDALSSLVAVEIPGYVHHPLDLSLLFEADVYIALCHLALGNQEKALEHAKLAFNNIAPMPHSPYKDFINETYEKIRSRH